LKPQDTRTWKIVVLALAVGLLGGILGSSLIAPFIGVPGPQGPQGAQGLQGPQGDQGPQGSPGQEGTQGAAGTNGTDAILQVLQNRNYTQVDTTSYAPMQWFNMSTFDPTMKLMVNIQGNSKILVLFSGTHYTTSPGSIWVRIVVDNAYNSSVYKCSSLAPASGIFNMAGHVELLTDPLSAGNHTIEVQFLRETGSPFIMDRTVTAMEITSP